MTLEERFGHVEDLLEQLLRIESHTNAIVTEHSQRLDTIDARLDQMDTRFDRIDARLDGIDAHLDRMVRKNTIH